MKSFCIALGDGAEDEMYALTCTYLLQNEMKRNQLRTALAARWQRREGQVGHQQCYVTSSS